MSATPPALAPALDLRGVERRFVSGDQDIIALAGVDLTLARGEMVALLGPSGSGKSTLLLIAGLLDTPSAGEVWIDGHHVAGNGVELADPRRFRRRHVGFVFQKPNLIPFLTATENVRLACEIDDVEPGAARRRALALLTFLEVGHRADAYPARLSGGEQQRVAVARALANAPSLIFADEPTAALDGARGRQVMELLRRVASEQQAAILVVTHDHRALDLVDRVLTMNDGRLCASDPHAARG